jgi:hypothetical protein
MSLADVSRPNSYPAFYPRLSVALCSLLLALAIHRSRDRNFTPILALKNPLHRDRKITGSSPQNNYPPPVVIVLGAPAADLLL